ncbi:MAG: TraR/DksA C4-type zinc finger protein [Ectothiorhodospiraceae bacterium]|nr:TraR/DksA C4-type zinc finger protein [Ectothiorhodospiraceae bacterium]
MLTDENIRELRQRLEAELAVLLGHRQVREAGAETVELDQTRTGRLSRMDALQGQAMAKAAAALAGERERRIRAALRRLDEGNYGDCVRCDEPIVLGRLMADPATAICIHCPERAERS